MGPADAGPVSQRPPGRGAGELPAGPAGAGRAAGGRAGPGVQRLQAAILAQDPALASVPAAVAPRGRLPAPVTSFVGRRAGAGGGGRAGWAAPAGEPDRSAWGRQEPACAGGGAGGGGRLRRRGLVRRACPRRAARRRGPGDGAHAGRPRADAEAATRWHGRSNACSQANVLLVLDGCEPVIEEAARVAAGVLAECPGVRVLATSREVLHLEGEVRVVVAPLAVPAAGADAREVAASESVRLFLERARASRPGLPLTEDRLALAAEICRRLDGLPLAIELAAARVSVLGLREILSALESRRPLFVEARDRRAVPQRYLRTVVAWSHDLLHTDERALLHQLAVFRGGVPLSAVLATAAREPDRCREGDAAAGRAGGQVDPHGVVPRWWSALRPARHRPRVRRRAAGQGRQPERGPTGARRVLRDRGRRRAGRASRARLAGLHQSAGAGARQPLGCAGLRPRRSRPGDRGPAGGGAGLVLRPRRAGLRGA